MTVKTQMVAVRGILAAAAATATLFAGTSPAHADEREQCAGAADQAQQLRDEGKYRRAREQMIVCARDVCPAPIKRDCLDWLTQLDTVAPTVVLGAKDKGADLVDVKVYVDNVNVADKLDGRPMPMDVGEHTFRFEYNGQTKEEKAVIGAGQKGRNIAVVFGAPVAGGGGDGGQGNGQGNGQGGDKGGEKEGSIIPALVVGGIGVVALGSFALFGITGKSAVDDLQNCKPHCAESDVDSARTKLIIADISLGVGIVALGVATYMFLTRPHVNADVKTGYVLPKEQKPALGTWSFDVRGLTGGAYGTVGATF